MDQEQESDRNIWAEDVDVLGLGPWIPGPRRENEQLHTTEAESRASASAEPGQFDGFVLDTQGDITNFDRWADSTGHEYAGGGLLAATLRQRLAMDGDDQSTSLGPRISAHNNESSRGWTDVMGMKSTVETPAVVDSPLGRGQSCFNCGGPHKISSCNLPMNRQNIASRKRTMMQQVDKANLLKRFRYHDPDCAQSSDDDRLVPGGVLSNELRNALSLKEGELPGYISNMRRVGYPPGYKAQLVDLYRKLKASEESGEILLDTRELSVDSVHSYPGFNCTPPQGYYLNSRLGQPFDYERNSKASFFSNLMKELKPPTPLTPISGISEALRRSTMRTPDRPIRYKGWKAEADLLQAKRVQRGLVAASPHPPEVHAEYPQPDDISMSSMSPTVSPTPAMSADKSPPPSQPTDPSAGSNGIGLQKNYNIEEKADWEDEDVLPEYDLTQMKINAKALTNLRGRLAEETIPPGEEAVWRRLWTSEEISRHERRREFLSEQVKRMSRRSEENPVEDSFVREMEVREQLAIEFACQAIDMEKRASRLNRSRAAMTAAAASVEKNAPVSHTESSSSQYEDSGALQSSQTTHYRRRASSPSLLTNFSPSSPPKVRESVFNPLGVGYQGKNVPSPKSDDEDDVEVIPYTKAPPPLLTIEEEVVNVSETQSVVPALNSTSSNQENFPIQNEDLHEEEDQDVRQVVSSGRGVFRNVFVNPHVTLPDLDRFATGVEFPLLLVPEAPSTGTYNRLHAILANRRNARNNPSNSTSNDNQPNT